MDKLKKHELLKYAYDNYPKYSIVGYDYLSGKEVSGIYDISQTGDVCDFENGITLYSNGIWIPRIKKEYAIGVHAKSPVSILSGKVAIQVNNEREFNLLMENYESKGWKNYGYPTVKLDFQPDQYVVYSDEFFRNIDSQFLDRGYSLIPFADFAREANIKMPVKIMVSEDGVDLYGGDSCFCSVFKDGKWILDEHTETLLGIYKFRCTDNGRFLNTDTEKTFSTKEAAEKWIEEHNLVYEVNTDRFGTLTVFKNGVGKDGIIYISDSQLEKIWGAFNKINETK